MRKETTMKTPILVTGAAGRVGAVGRTVTELLLPQGHAMRALVRQEETIAPKHYATWEQRWSVAHMSITARHRRCEAA
jgi:nucleoside-diphosphate-sugar epimerase